MNHDAKIEALIQREESDPRLGRLLVAMRHRLPGKPTYCDARAGIESNWTYVKRFTPQIKDGGLRIMEIGPGVGSWMIIARELGNDVVGEDLPVSGGMSWSSDHYAGITAHRGLPVKYHGFHKYLTTADHGYEPGSFDMIHSRGSLSGVLWSLTGGDQARVAHHVSLLLSLFGGLLKSGGLLHIAHNAGPPAEAWCAEIDRGITWDVITNTPRICKLVKA